MAGALDDAKSPSLAFENLPGAGGARGLERANALAAAGEPVLMLGTPTTQILLPGRIGVAPDARFAPVVGLGAAPNVLLVPPSLGVDSVEALVELARREPLAFASAGTGQTIHVCGAYFCELAGVRMTHRPYDGGSATAYADFFAGRVHMYFDSLLGAREHIASGKALPLAVSAARRSAVLPHVPTLAERGFPTHALEVWLGVFAANAPVDPARALRDPGVREKLEKLGLEGGPLDRAAFHAQVETSRVRWLTALASAR